MVQTVKNLTEMREIRVRSLGWEDPLEEGMAAHSSIPAWRIPMDCSPPGSSVPGFSRQEYWSGLPCPPPGDLPDPGVEPQSPAVQADALLPEPLGKPLQFSSVQLLSHVRLFVIPWTVAYKVPPFMEFSRQEY